MKITLHNFRCYTERKIDLGDNGITLISGNSGKGKTTILVGIFFALFGQGNKLIKHGCTSCKVILEVDEKLIITRTKRPNTLTVNGKYIGEDAQNIINEQFCTIFRKTGYIEQNSMSSFLFMSSNEKLKFIEQFAFNHIDVASYKNKINKKIKEFKQAFISFKGQLEGLFYVAEHKQIIKKVTAPNKNEKHISKSAINDMKKKLELLQKQYNDLTHQLIIIKSKEDEFINNTKSIENIKEKMEKLKENIRNIGFKGAEFLKEKKNELMNIMKYKEYIKHLKNIGDLKFMKQKETEKINECISKIKTKLWKKYKTKDNLLNLIEENKECLKDIYKIKNIRSKLNKTKNNTEAITEIKKSIDDTNKKINQTKTIKCPECETYLILNNDKLYISETKPKRFNLEQLEKEKSKLLVEQKKLICNENLYSIYCNELKHITDLYCGDICKDENNVKLNINNLQRYLKEQYQKEFSLQELEKKKKECEYSESIKLLEQQIKDKNVLFKNTHIDIVHAPIDIDVHLLNSNIEKQTKLKHQTELLTQKYINYEKNVQDMFETQNRLSKQIENKYKIYKKQKSIQSDINILQKQIEKAIKLDLQYLKYNSYIKEKNERDILDKRIEMIKTKQNNISHHLYTHELYMEKIIEAQSLSISQLITNLNNIVQIYLNLFFIDNPISIQLQTFKTTKKNKKPYLSFMIIYKGNETTLSCLSGGEISRINIAFNLAFSEIYNHDFILLDECTGSLDEKLTSHVIKSIKTRCVGKLIIIIAHQVIKGQFDKIIQI